MIRCYTYIYTLNRQFRKDEHLYLLSNVSEENI